MSNFHVGSFFLFFPIFSHPDLICAAFDLGHVPVLGWPTRALSAQ